MLRQAQHEVLRSIEAERRVEIVEIGRGVEFHDRIEDALGATAADGTRRVAPELVDDVGRMQRVGVRAPVGGFAMPQLAAVLRPDHDLAGVVAWEGRFRVDLVADALAKRQDLRVADRLRIERSEEHTSELQSLMRISYAVFCLKQKKSRQLTRPRQARGSNMKYCRVTETPS